MRNRLRTLKPSFYWFNDSARAEPAAWPRQGRAFFQWPGARAVSIEWSLFDGAFGVSFSTSDEGSELTVGARALILSLFLSLQWPRLFSRLLPERRDYRTGEKTGIPEDREIRFGIHSGALWWTIWREPLGGWDSSVPRWREGSLHPVRVVLGKEKEILNHRAEPVPVWVPMPEGSYAAEVTEVNRAFKRPRWPRPRRLRYFELQIPAGIPFRGKGESCYDCGDDGLFGTSGSSPEDAIASAVGSVLKSRRRYGTPKEVTRAGVLVAGRTEETTA